MNRGEIWMMTADQFGPARAKLLAKSRLWSWAFSKPYWWVVPQGVSWWFNIPTLEREDDLLYPVTEEYEALERRLLFIRDEMPLAVHYVFSDPDYLTALRNSYAEVKEKLRRLQVRPAPENHICGRCHREFSLGPADPYTGVRWREPHPANCAEGI